MPGKSPIEKWIDDHRELILLIVILPLGKLITIVDRMISAITRPRPLRHDGRVERITRDVLSARRSGKPLRTDRSGTRTLVTRVSDKSDAVKVRIRDLRCILAVDKERQIVRVEPFVTMGELVAFLDNLGWEPEASIEMKDATLGGLVLAIGMTTHSHVSGLMHDTVEAYELITPEGEWIRATRDGEHAELFRALPWSHGTLGFLVALELRIRPAPRYVRLVYRPFFDLEEFAEEHARLLTADNPPFYLEGQIFGLDKAVIIEGHPAEESLGPVNTVDAWYKPFFFKHVESMLELGPGAEYQEWVPNASYLMRHERSMCMTLGKILPTANRGWYRRLFGWLLPPNLALLKSSRPPEERERSMRRQVYQDFAFPAESLTRILRHLDKEFAIYPLLLYPCRVIDRGGMVRLPGFHGKNWDGAERSCFYRNLGVYGTPRAVREGSTDYPTVAKVREVEALIRDLGGFLHTYVDVFSTEEEFEAMFDHGLWREIRKKVGAEKVLPTVYEKVKPELDPFRFVESR